MSLEYKKSVRENITDLETFVVDTTPTSTNYFRVSDVPQVLQKGKNLLRITAHPTNLTEGSQVYVDVRDSNGNPIYYEIPDYLEDDKSRVISIWIYHDKGEDNTPNGQATITLAGTTNVNLDGSVLPERARNKINVKWQAVVTVDRDRSNTSEIVFDSTNVPSVVISQSIEGYQNQTQSEGQLQKTIQTGTARYVFSPYGQTPVIFTLDGSTFNDEMVGGDIILNNYTNPPTPVASIDNPLNDTFFSSSIKEVILPNDKYVKTTTNYTTTFQDRDDLVHTYQTVLEGDYKVEYFTTASNITTENQRNFVNLSLSNIDPIAGVVDKVKILQKSDGLSGDYELLNEVTIPFSSSVEIKVPIPSKNLNDPKILKLQYLNSVGAISRTQTITDPFVFTGENVYIGGKENMISGSIFVSDTVGTGIEIGGASSGFLRSVGYEGQISASLGKAPGGFVIYSGSGNLVMGDDVLNGVGMQFVGDNDDRHLIFTTDDGGLLDVKTDKFFIGTDDTQFISGSDSNIEISSSLFHLDPKNETLIIGAGTVINADLSVDQMFTPATINGEQSNITNASASITSGGFARFVSASIGGWDVTTASIEGSNLIMKPEGVLQTKDYIPDTKGWFISAQDNGVAEFENIKIRGTLRTTTFEKESVNAVGGQLYVANSTTLTGSISESISVDANNGFTSSTDLPSSAVGFNIAGGNARLEVDGTEYKITTIDYTNETFETNTALALLSQSVNLNYTGSDTAVINVTAHQSYQSSSIRQDTGVFETTTSTPFKSLTIDVSSTLVSADPSKLTSSDFAGETGTVTITGVTFGPGGDSSTTATYNDGDNKLELDLRVLSALNAGTEVTFSNNTTIQTTAYKGTDIVTSATAHGIPADNFGTATVAFNDGGGSHSFPITEVISSTELRIDTSSNVPNTSGSTVVGLFSWQPTITEVRSISSGPPIVSRTSFDNISPSASIFTVDNVSGFVADEILTLKKITDTGFATEYVKVVSTERIDAASDKDQSGYLTVVRGFGSGSTGDSGSLGDLASVSQSYEGGQVIVSTGREGTGYIRINANPNDTSTPYIDIVERTGSGLYDVELKARLGDLSGLDGTDMVLGKSNPGFGLATDNVYLQGGISANFGDIGGFGISETTISSSNDNLILRDSGQITGSDVLFSGGTIGGFELTSTQINSTNDNLILKSNGEITASAANIDGDITSDNITATGGEIGGFLLTEDRLSSTNDNLILQSDGNITALGGTLGGFTLGSTQINSTNNNLILKANGEITASDANIDGDITTDNITATGGTIGGFELTSTQINSTNNDLILESNGEITANAGTIGGVEITSTGLESTTNLGSPDNSPAFELTDTGVISGSNLFIRKVFDVGNGDESVALIDTKNGLIDARNLGRQVISDSTVYSRTNVDDGSTYYTVQSYYFQLLPYENVLSITGICTAFSDNYSDRMTGRARVRVWRMANSGSSDYDHAGLANSPFDTEEDSSGVDTDYGWDLYTSTAASGVFNAQTTSTVLGSTAMRIKDKSQKYSIPEALQGEFLRVDLQLNANRTAGNTGTGKGVQFAAFGVIATRDLTASSIGGAFVK